MERHKSETCPFCASGEWFHAPALPTYPDAHVMAPRGTKWVLFTKRTEDPKLTWLEARLEAAGVPCRRKGASFHGARGASRRRLEGADPRGRRHGRR